MRDSLNIESEFFSVCKKGKAGVNENIDRREV